MTRILIAEPSPDVRLLLRRVVARLGYEPVELDSSIRARPEGFDALLLEPALFRGIDLAHAARRRNPALPIVLCSIYPPSPELAELRPSAHLVKPFQRDVLESALRAAIEAPGAHAVAG